MNGFRYCRKRAGLKMTDVARKLNVSYATVCAWEAGRCCPQGARVIALAKLYNCSFDELYIGAGELQSAGEREERAMREFEEAHGLVNR